MHRFHNPSDDPGRIDMDGWQTIQAKSNPEAWQSQFVGWRGLHLVNPLFHDVFFVMITIDKLWRCMISLNEKVRHHQQDAFVPWHLTIFDHEIVTRKSQNPAVATGHRVDVGESALHDRPLATWAWFKSNRPHHIHIFATGNAGKRLIKKKDKG